MTTVSLPKSSFIGFDDILSELSEISTNSKNLYPPHNVIKHSKNSMEIEFAVAGFKLTDLHIELKNNILTVKGDREKRRPENIYVYHGISIRKFSKSFRLSEYTEITEASLTEGILSISISVNFPEEKEPITIQIKKDNPVVGK